MRPALILVLAAVLPAAHPAAPAEAACGPARVHYTPYPGHDESLSKLPWVRGDRRSRGLAGLLWYWPPEWTKRKLRQARIFTGGEAPAGTTTKILWAFTDPSARTRGGSVLVVRGRRLGGSGRTRQEFGAISYAYQDGAPSYASIVDLPTPGCWRLTLSTGSLRAHLDVRAVKG